MKYKVWLALVSVLLTTVLVGGVALADSSVFVPGTLDGSATSVEATITQNYASGTSAYANTVHPSLTYTNSVTVHYIYHSAYHQEFTKNASANSTNARAYAFADLPYLCHSHAAYSYCTINQPGVDSWSDNTMEIHHEY